MDQEPAEVVGSGNPKMLLNEATRDISAVVTEVLGLKFYSVKLEGYQKNLFKKSFSFVEAPKNFTQNPTLTLVDCLQELIEFSAHDISSIEIGMKYLLAPITAFLETYTFDNGLERPAAVFLQYFFKFFLDLPIISLREVHFRDRKTEGGKKKVLGKIDVIAGRQKNGRKPSITVNVDSNTVKKVFFGSSSEVQIAGVRLSGHLEDSRTPDGEDLKSVYQPITELCALSEVCTYSDDSKAIPLVNIFASRNTFRPFLYFKEYDVLLTTLTPITYVRKDKVAFDIHGLALLKLLFSIDCYPFREDKLEGVTKSMWKAAKDGQGIYDNVWLSTEAPGAEDASKSDPNIMPFRAMPISERVKRRTAPGNPPSKKSRIEKS